VRVPLPPVDELNRLDTADLAGALSKLFEHAPLLFERLARRRPFRSYRALLDAAREEVLRMAESEQAALLAAHPRIGAPERALSEASRREQGEAASPEIEDELARLNEEYRQRFGFPFVVFVDGRSRAEIRAVLRQRLDRSRAVELGAGLEALLSIAERRAGLR
jgi:OHCU decarboxylase